jgi:hypothetical protein
MFHRNPDWKIRNRYSLAKGQAKRRKWEFTLTYEQYKGLIEKPCEYCQKELNKTGSCLDRADSSIGYTLSNSVPCCHDCNLIKNNLLSHAEMKLVSRFLERFRKCKTPSQQRQFIAWIETFQP